MADNEIRLNVTAVESEPLNVCVKQVPMNPVNVENTYKGIDYNLLKNKPSIDGVTLEGDKTTAEVIGFDKEYVDEAILATNAKIDSVEQDLSDKIDAVSTDNFYTKEEIDNKVIVIEADIDANADAILKTRGDFMESDSELQQQINAHAEELTTQRNDIDGLGDQVAGIEGKIPETATDANPLVTKQDLLDAEMDIRDDVDTKDGELQEQLNAQAAAIAGKQDTLTAGEGISIDGNVISATGGGGEVPDNVYTQDNLIAGKNVTFTEVPPEGGIDEHTLACWHFDENNIDEVNNVSIEVDGLQYSDTSGAFKFGKSLTFASSGAKSQDISSEFSLTNNWTIDCWIYFDSWSGKEVYLLNKNDNTYYKNYGLCIQNSGTIQLKDTIFTTDVSLTNSLHHYAVSVERKEDSNESYAYLFIDGVLQNKVVLNNWSGFSISCLYLKTSGSKDSVNIDELRISDCVRWTEDFTPPTKAYTVATGPSKTAIDVELPEVGVAEAVKNQNALESAVNPIYNWVGTLAEYQEQNIATEHPEWIVMITDDDHTDITSWGSIIGTVADQTDLVSFVDDKILDAEMNIREDIDAKDSELQTQINGQATAIAQLNSRIPTNMDFVVESYNDGNGNWWEKYKSGKVRQGGLITYSQERDARKQVTLLLPMKDTNYYVSISGRSIYRSDTDLFAFNTAVGNMTTTGFLTHIYGLSAADFSDGMFWIAEGQGAE